MQGPLLASIIGVVAGAMAADIGALPVIIILLITCLICKYVI